LTTITLLLISEAAHEVLNCGVTENLSKIVKYLRKFWTSQRGRWWALVDDNINRDPSWYANRL